jgi:hypothetical protein
MVRIGDDDKEYRLTMAEAQKDEELVKKMFEDTQDGQTVLKLKDPYFNPVTENGQVCTEIWRVDQDTDADEDKHLHGSGPVFDDNAQQTDLMGALHKGTLTSAVSVCLFAALLCYLLFDYSDYQENQIKYYFGGPSDKESEAWRIYGCVLIGLACGVLIGILTEYCTSYSYYPVKSIANAGTTGEATVIIQGLGVGMMSCFPPTFVIVATILACNELMLEYGVSVAAVSMLSTLGITLATDAYGPVADNAGGLAEMVEELPASVRKTTDALDALGNTTAATGKGFAIGSAVLTSLSLLNAFEDRVTGSSAIDTSVNDSIVLAGIVFGSMLPFLFAALTMISVGLAAQELIRAVRDDFKEKKEEEAAAINASAAAPYEPWAFTKGRYDKLDDATKAKYPDSKSYYKGTLHGREVTGREDAVKHALGAPCETGLTSVTLQNLVFENGKYEDYDPQKHAEGFFAQHEPLYHGSHQEVGTNGKVSFKGSSNERHVEHHNAVDTSMCELSKLPAFKEQSTPETWTSRQSAFDTNAWRGLRGWAPNSRECIRISTVASIREMMLPGVYAIFTPVFIGFLIGARCLMGVLAGSVGAGAMMAIMMSNAGGAWDNSKKYIEIAGAHDGKGTSVHKACVVGDTVGDPFKDTSGPALNILLKLMAMVSLTISTLLKGQDDWEIAYYAFIPGVIIIAATAIYCCCIYGQAEKQELLAQTEAPPPQASPKKQKWHDPAVKTVETKMEPQENPVKPPPNEEWFQQY